MVDSDKYKKDNYHLEKFKLSELNNTKLFTIWEDDWNSKQDICKSFILNKLNRTPRKLYASKIVR
jgi:hypothetical protein